MRWFKVALDFFLYGNIFIGICAVGLTASSFILSGIPLDENIHLLIFSFAVTVVSYGFHALNRSGENTSDPRLIFINQYRIVLWWITSLSALGSLVLLFLLSAVQILFCMHLAVLSFFYTSGFTVSGRKFILSHIPYLKVFLIAYAWMVLTVLFPLWDQISQLDLLISSIERFLLIFALAIPFDIRDLKSDLRNKIKTFPSLLGERKAAYLVILLISLVVGYRFMLSGSGFPLYAIIGTLILVILILPSIITKKTPYLFSLGVDGMMLAYFLFIVAFSSF